MTSGSGISSDIGDLQGGGGMILRYKFSQGPFPTRNCAGHCRSRFQRRMNPADSETERVGDSAPAYLSASIRPIEISPILEK